MSSLTQHEAEREKSEKRVHAYLPCRSRVTAVLSDIVRLRACIIQLASALHLQDVRARRLYHDSDLAKQHGITPARDNYSAVNILLVLKLKVCRCKGKFQFRIFFMAAPRPRKEAPLDSGEKGVRGFPDSAYCIVFHLLLTSVNLPKALVMSEGYHVVSLAILV
jgi:hypothetical protein